MNRKSRGWSFLAFIVLALGFTTASAAPGPVVVQLTNQWRYNQTTSYDGVNWTARNFDDSTLPFGAGVLAVESGNNFVTSRTRTTLTLGRTTYYFRTRFTFTNDIAGVALTFSNIVDDGAVFHLNGVEIFRSFMSAGAVAYATLASNHEATDFDVVTVSGPVVETNLVNGENVLAVEVHQTTVGSTDIVFGSSVSVSFPELTPLPLRMPLEPPVYGYTTTNAFPGLNFGAPVAITAPPGETNRLFVVDKAGRILVITNLASPNLTTFLNISGPVEDNGESGFLGLAFHPGYATNRYFYVFYSVIATTSQGANSLHQRVSRFQTLAGNPNLADATSEQLLITQADPAGNHNGGDLQFGPDGLLYISVGDGGPQYDGAMNSQRIDRDFFSAIMRIDVDVPFRGSSIMPNLHPANNNGGSINYRVPFDNPYIGRTSFNGIAVTPSNIRTEFYAIGFRNPWRFSFDPGTGLLYCGDVGQDAWEEISIISRGGNYGWVFRDAAHPGFRTGTPSDPLIDPILEYAHGSGAYQGNAVIGGVVYRGARLPQLQGAYVFGDNTSGNLWTLRYAGTNATNFTRIANRTGMGGIGVDPRNGDVLIAQVGGGGVFRLVYDTNNAIGVPIPPTLAQTGAFTNLVSLTNSVQPLAASGGLISYDVNVPFWSDGAGKTRWFLPATNGSIGFSAENHWTLPSGMAWVKHFDIEMTNGVPSSSKRLETRLLVRNQGGVYGVTYRWGNTVTNATLVPEDGLNESLATYEGSTVRTQVWRYPSRGECVMCHTPQGGLALGFNTPQLNREIVVDGTNVNQIAAMHAAGHFTGPIGEINRLRALAPASDDSSSAEWRVRSYIAANCASCHQPGGTGLGSWNASITNTTLQAGLINGALNNNFGNVDARVIAPGSISNSMLLSRISTRGAGQMPPIGSTVVDAEAVRLVSEWITNDLAAGWSNNAAPPLISASASTGDVMVQFTQPANRAHRIETTTNLGPVITWNFLDVPANQPSYPSSNTAVSVSDPGTNGQRFYRVRIMEP